MKYRDYLIVPAIIMYILFASCAFVAKGNNDYINEITVSTPEPSVNPSEISWGEDNEAIGEYWYANGQRSGEYFAVETASTGKNDIYFYSSSQKADAISQATPYIVKNMHMQCSTSDGRDYDLIFLDEMTAYDCVSCTYYQRADYDTLISQLTSGKFVNSTNSRDYYVFKSNGKSYEYFGDQLYKGDWNFNTAETVVVYDHVCKDYFNFNILFDTYGNISGFTFNEIVYNLVN